MAQKITGAMPDTLDLDVNYTVQWAALNPTTGAPVAGVKVSNAALIVTKVTPGSADELAFGPFVPQWVPIPNEEINAT